MDNNQDNKDVFDRSADSAQSETESFHVEIHDGLHNTASENAANNFGDIEYQDEKNQMVEDDFKRIKTIQNQSLAASICGAISVIIGGVILSSVGLALGIAAFMKYRKLKSTSYDEALLKKIKVSSIVAMVLPLGALVLNFITALVLMPSILSYLQTGDLSSLYSALDVNQGATSSRSATWG